MSKEKASAAPPNPELHQRQMALVCRIWAGKDAFSRLQDNHLSLEEQEHLQAVFENGQKAKEDFIDLNTGLVKKIAIGMFEQRRSYYLKRGYDFDYLIDCGKIGLLEGLRRYDPNKGKIATYMPYWIKRVIQEYTGGIITTPHREQTITSKLFWTENVLWQRLGRQPTKEEISLEIGIPPDKTEKLLIFSQQPASLNASAGENNLSLEEAIPDTSRESAENQALRKVELSQIFKLLEKIPSEEALVVSLYFGLKPTEPKVEKSFGKIGQLLGCSGEKCRYVYHSGIQHLREISQQLR